MKKNPHGLTQPPWASAKAGKAHRDMVERDLRQKVAQSSTMTRKYGVPADVFMQLTALGIDREGIRKAEAAVMHILVISQRYGSVAAGSLYYVHDASPVSKPFVTTQPQRYLGRKGKRTSVLPRVKIWDFDTAEGWLPSLFDI